jgi:hypothetical protein
MDLTIGSYKCRLEICLLIVFISFILFSHLFCSCSRVGLKEGFDIIKTVTNKIKNRNARKF